MQGRSAWTLAALLLSVALVLSFLPRTTAANEQEKQPEQHEPRDVGDDVQAFFAVHFPALAALKDSPAHQEFLRLDRRAYKVHTRLTLNERRAIVEQPLDDLFRSATAALQQHRKIHLDGLPSKAKNHNAAWDESLIRSELHAIDTLNRPVGRSDAAHRALELFKQRAVRFVRLCMAYERIFEQALDVPLLLAREDDIRLDLMHLFSLFRHALAEYKHAVCSENLPLTDAILFGDAFPSDDKSLVEWDDRAFAHAILDAYPQKPTLYAIIFLL